MKAAINLEDVHRIISLDSDEEEPHHEDHHEQGDEREHERVPPVSNNISYFSNLDLDLDSHQEIIYISTPKPRPPEFIRK